MLFGWEWSISIRAKVKPFAVAIARCCCSFSFAVCVAIVVFSLMRLKNDPLQYIESCAHIRAFAFMLTLWCLSTFPLTFSLSSSFFGHFLYKYSEHLFRYEFLFSQIRATGLRLILFLTYILLQDSMNERKNTWFNIFTTFCAVFSV